jgi:prepilin signal peptidase PulO-like enzyme (type II secretory pathway)
MVLNAIALSSLIAVFVYDLRHKIIPDHFSLSFALLSLLPTLAVIYIFSIPFFSMDVLYWLLSAPALALPFFLLWYFSGGRWMGLGDAKLAWGMGWFLGLSAGFASLVLAFWIGAVFSLIMLAIQSLSGKGKGLTMKSEVPFGPYLIVALLVVYFFDIDFPTLIAWFAL